MKSVALWKLVHHGLMVKPGRAWVNHWRSPRKRPRAERRRQRARIHRLQQTTLRSACAAANRAGMLIPGLNAPAERE